MKSMPRTAIAHCLIYENEYLQSWPDYLAHAKSVDIVEASCGTAFAFIMGLAWHSKQRLAD